MTFLENKKFIIKMKICVFNGGSEAILYAIMLQLTKSYGSCGSIIALLINCKSASIEGSLNSIFIVLKSSLGGENESLYIR